jgi:hypothetical protein
MALAADKAKTACARHQDAVAKLTADNLMFMMRMKKAEAEAEQLRKQSSELRQGLEYQEGPWFDTVMRCCASLEIRFFSLCILTPPLQSIVCGLPRQSYPLVAAWFAVSAPIDVRCGRFGLALSIR